MVELHGQAARFARPAGHHDVGITHGLTDLPTCLVVGEGDISADLERQLKWGGQAADSLMIRRLLACG